MVDLSLIAENYVGYRLDISGAVTTLNDLKFSQLAGTFGAERMETPKELYTEMSWRYMELEKRQQRRAGEDNWTSKLVPAVADDTLEMQALTNAMELIRKNYAI